QALAEQLWLNRAEHRRAAHWIAMLEHMLRRLLYLDAVLLTPALRAACEQKARAPRSTSSGGALFDPACPERWRTAFALALRESASGRGRRGGGFAPARLSSANLSLRLEAIVRAYNAREDYAQRFANLIARDARRAAAQLRALAQAPASRAPYGRRENTFLAWACAATGLPPWADSS
ncbi:MAG: hypothetical protein AB7P07_15220, partial [Hyphomonadaceae bacterium]